MDTNLVATQIEKGVVPHSRVEPHRQGVMSRHFSVNRRVMLLALLAMLLLVVAGCSSGDDDPVAEPPTVAPAPATNTPVVEAPSEPPPAEEPAPQPQAVGPVDLLDTLASRGNFSQLLSAIQASGLEEKLRSAGPYTILAPTDDAFATLSPDILADSELLYDILLYHVVEGPLNSSNIADQIVITTLLGDDLTVTVDGANIRLDGAVVTERDIEATNGILHVIDTVLLPPSSGLIRTPAGAPVARAALPHLLEMIRADGRFEILLDGLNASGLTLELTGSGPFTLFAPTDDAFLQFVENAPVNVLHQLDREPALVLRHFLIADELHSFRLVDGSSWLTLDGSQLAIAAANNGLAIVGNDGTQAALTKTDLQASNGIVHIIDSVVLPSTFKTLVSATE